MATKGVIDPSTIDVKAILAQYTEEDHKKFTPLIEAAKRRDLAAGQALMAALSPSDRIKANKYSEDMRKISIRQEWATKRIKELEAQGKQNTTELADLRKHRDFLVNRNANRLADDMQNLTVGARQTASSSSSTAAAYKK